MTPEFAEQVEAKIEASEGVGGWAKGPAAIIAEISDELVDVCGWDRGLDAHPEPPGAAELRATIRHDANLLWEATKRLAEIYRTDAARDATMSAKQIGPACSTHRGHGHKE